MKFVFSLTIFLFVFKYSFSLEINNTLSSSYFVYPNNKNTSINSKKASELKIETYYDIDQIRLVSELLARLDSEDSGRRQLEAREAYLNSSYSNVDIFIGHRQVFWGVNESRNIVDIINQKDSAANEGSDAKLGSPSISVEKITNFGDNQLWFIPRFRNKTFNDSDSHPSSGIEVLSSSYERKDGQNANDYAYRISNSYNSWDYAGSIFYGTSRDPILKKNISNTGLEAFYPKLRSFGFEGQFTGEQTLLKLETLSGIQSNENFFSIVNGIEYTKYGILEKNWDLGFILESQFDDRPQAVSNQFFVIGKRLILNDTSDSNVLTLLTIDNYSDQSFFTLEGSRRINEWSSIEISSKFYNAKKQSSPFKQLSDDDEIQLKLKIYF